MWPRPNLYADDPGRDPWVARCDDLAASATFACLGGHVALPACEQATDAYQEGADLGMVAALNNVATLHKNCEGVPPSPKTAFPFLRGRRRGRRRHRAGPRGRLRALPPGAGRGDSMAMATVAVLIDNSFGEHFPDLDAAGLVLDALSEGEAGVTAVLPTTAGAQQLSPDTARALQAAVIESGHCCGRSTGSSNRSSSARSTPSRGRAASRIAENGLRPVASRLRPAPARRRGQPLPGSGRRRLRPCPPPRMWLRCWTTSPPVQPQATRPWPWLWQGFPLTRPRCWGTRRRRSGSAWRVRWP